MSGVGNSVMHCVESHWSREADFWWWSWSSDWPVRYLDWEGGQDWERNEAIINLNQNEGIWCSQSTWLHWKAIWIQNIVNDSFQWVVAHFLLLSYKGNFTLRKNIPEGGFKLLAVHGPCLLSSMPALQSQWTVCAMVILHHFCNTLERWAVSHLRVSYSPEQTSLIWKYLIM
jgi:hypothetical protein